MTEPDYVAINRRPTAVEVIGDLRPDFYVKGAVKTDGKRDHSDAITREEEAIAAGHRLVAVNLGEFLDQLAPVSARFRRQCDECRRGEIGAR